MCGRFTLRTPLTVLSQQFLFDLGPAGDELLRPRINIAPTQDVPAVRANLATGKRELTFFRWGLIPSWADDMKIGAKMINARGETVAEKPSFRSAFARRRCLVLADGYYEWKTEGKVKTPYCYRMQDDRPFAFAGLWETWRGPEKGDGPPLESCTLITTNANELAAEIHDRMPVILEPADYDLWLDPKEQDRERLKKLLAPYPAEEMKVEKVTMRLSREVA